MWMQVSIDASWDCPERSLPREQRQSLADVEQGPDAGVTFQGQADPPDVRQDSIGAIGERGAIATGKWRCAR